MKDYYQILGIAADASPQEIKRRFRFLSLAFHPDKFGGNTEHFKIEAGTAFKEINEAYEILADPLKRTNYNNRRLSSIQQQVKVEIELQNANVKIKQLKNDLAKILEEWKIQAQKDRQVILELRKELHKKNQITIFNSLNKSVNNLSKMFSTRAWLFWGIPAVVGIVLLCFFIPFFVPSPIEPVDESYGLFLLNASEHIFPTPIPLREQEILQNIKIGEIVNGKGKILAISTNHALVNVGQSEWRIELFSASFFNPQVSLVNMSAWQTSKLYAAKEVEFTAIVASVSSVWPWPIQVKLNHVEIMNN